MLLNELFEVSQDLVSRYKTAAIKDADKAIAAKAAGTMGRGEYERKMTKRGRGTAAAQRRLTPQGTRLDLTPYGDAIQRDYDRYRTDEQGVAEGTDVAQPGQRVTIITPPKMIDVLPGDTYFVRTSDAEGVTLDHRLGTRYNNVKFPHGTYKIVKKQGVAEGEKQSNPREMDLDWHYKNIINTKGLSDKAKKDTTDIYNKLKKKKEQGVAEGSQPNDIAVYHHTGPDAETKAKRHAMKLGSEYGHFKHDMADKNDNLHVVTQKRYFPAYAKQQGMAEGSEQRWRVTVGNKSGTLSHTKTFTGTKEQAIKQAVTRFATTRNPVVTAELVKQGMAEASKEKTPGVALSKAYQKDFDGIKPVNRRPETALTGTYSKTGKPGGELKKRSVAEGRIK
jgi:hypothetical protein